MDFDDIEDAYMHKEITKYEYLDLMVKNEIYYKYNRIYEVLADIDEKINESIYK